jgi:hypothetical protein
MRRTLSCLALALVVLLPNAGQTAEITGRIFLDRNGNGRLDADEPGVASVLVSDGLKVAASDATGSYRLAASAAPALLRITVPRDHAAPRGFWRWTGGASNEDFALVSRPQPDHYCFIQVTDTHVGDVEALKLFCQRVNAFPRPIAFVVNTGDLVGGVDVVAPERAPQQFERYLDGVKGLRVPLLNVPGNHEHVAINVKEADAAHPNYGKGYYRKHLGPMHYSWDWGPVHYMALDGTTLPYQEKLGPDQLAWLSADLQLQPKQKPLVLFCHQSLPALRDAKELAKVLQGHRLLAVFCGHWHNTSTTELAGAPLFHTGALSGSWWSGPNPDGSPQGFRFVEVGPSGLETVYTSREGEYSLYVSSPNATRLQSGEVPFEVSVLDFGKPVQVTARWADAPVALTLAQRRPNWSIWKGTFDSRKLDDGTAVLEVRTSLGDSISVCPMRYLVVNGRETPYRADEPAVLKLQVRSVHAVEEVLLDGRPLGTIPADTPNETTLSLNVPAERLGKLVRVTVRSGARNGRKDNFSVGPIWLEYKGRRIYDLRFVTFERHAMGDAAPGRKPERDWYFDLLDGEKGRSPKK